jgi:hypothetical protein
MIDGIRKFYIRYRENLPETEMHYLAEQGFRELGVETVPYHWNDHLFLDVGPYAGVAGYLDDVWAALKQCGRPRPEAFDYPEALRPWFGRKIERTTLGKVRGTLTPKFIKPVEHKLFAGFVHKGDGESRMRLVTLSSKEHDAAEIWTSPVVNFVTEHRVFVLRGEILDVRRYKGDWGAVPRRRTIEDAVATWTDAPAAYCLDFGLTAPDCSTLLVEANDALAFGTYGLSGANYARMLAARWAQLSTAT